MSIDVRDDLLDLARRLRIGPRLRFIRRRFWRRWDELIFAFDIRDTKQTTARIPVTFETLTLDSLRGSADVPELDLVPRYEILARLRRGHLCALVRSEGRVILYGWFGISVWNLEDIGISARLDAGEAFLYDVYASENARGNRVFLAFISYATKDMVKRGYNTLYARVRRRNVAALVGPKFFGFVERIELNSVRILSCLRIHDAVLVKGSGTALRLLTEERTRMGAGLLIWRAGDRSGYRINLPRGHTIMPAPWVPAAGAGAER